MDYIIKRLEELQRPAASDSGPPGPINVTPVPRVQNTGFWTLLYASNGAANAPNVLASLLHFVCSIPGIDVGRVTQDLQASNTEKGPMQLENSVLLSMGTFSSVCRPCQGTSQFELVSRVVTALLVKCCSQGDDGQFQGMRARPAQRLWCAGPFGTWKLRVKGHVKASLTSQSEQCIFHEVALRPVNILGIETDFLPEVAVPLPSQLQDEHRLQTTVADGNLRIVHSSDGFVYVFERAE